MKKWYTMISKILVILSFVTVLVGCQESKDVTSRVESLPYYNEASFTPHWYSADDKILDTFHQISPFSLVNQKGEIVTEKTLEGKIYITDFFYTTCPGICPKMTNNMAIIQDAFLYDDEVILLSHSVTPSKDSVAVLRDYGDAKGVNPAKWFLVTGAKSEIYKLGRKDYFIEEDLGVEKSDEDFLHTENFVLIDKNRHIRGIYNGLNKTSINQLIADVNTLKEE